MGTRQTTTYDDKGNKIVLPNGITRNGKSLRIGFSYKGEYRKETLKGYKINKTSAKYAGNLKIEIDNKIERNEFTDEDYVKYFPKSSYAKEILTKKGDIGTNNKTSHFVDGYIDFVCSNTQQSTEINYRGTIKKLLSENMPKNINEIDFTTIENTKIALLKKYTLKTASARLKTVFSFLEYLKNKKIIPLDFDPKKAGTISAPNKDPDPFTIDEYHKLIAFQRNQYSNSLIYTQLIFTLACYTGLRFGELTALCRNDIDMNNLTLNVKRNFSPITNQFCTPKTDSGVRTIFLQPPAIKALNTLLETPAPSQLTVDIYQKGEVIRQETIVPLLKNTQNNILKPRIIYRRLRDMIKGAGVRYRRPYQTRHTFACWNLTAHGNVSFIASQMGHSGFLELQRTYGKFMDQYSPREAQFIWKQMAASGHQID